MLKIEGKTFMNIQEAVQWLLDNNALPFQSTANYAGNTEIGLGTIVNPSPAKVRIGSLIFFADSKVSTVTGITETGFICSDQYNDLVDDVVYISNVELDASGYLTVYLSNGNQINAGLIKQVSGFSIDASQHLIASYNDGTSTDLGAIFSGNITISGNLTVTGQIDGNTKLEKIVDSAGHNRFIEGNIDIASVTGITFIYAKWSLSGTHLMMVVAGTVEAGTTIPDSTVLATIALPSWLRSKIYAVEGQVIETKPVNFYKQGEASVFETVNLTLAIRSLYDLDIRNISGNKTLANATSFRAEFDLLIDNA